jgi:hypothetical protein
LDWNQAVAFMADQIRAAIEAELFARKLLTGAIDPDCAKELDAERQVWEKKVWEWAA